MVKTIIFDYGNVIFDIEHARTLQAFMRLGLQEEGSFFGHLQQNPVFDEFEKGLLSDADFRLAIRPFLAEQISDEQLDDAWNSLLIGIRPGYLDFLLQVKQRYQTFLLSNNNSIHFAWIQKYLQETFEINGMSQYFQKDYYSHLMGMRKPDAEIFEFVLDTHQLNPSETLFIDDSPQHINTAKSLGIQTHLMLPHHDLRTIISL